jgi:hypothetical protein
MTPSPNPPEEAKANATEGCGYCGVRHPTIAFATGHKCVPMLEARLLSAQRATEEARGERGAALREYAHWFSQAKQLSEEAQQIHQRANDNAMACVKAESERDTALAALAQARSLLGEAMKHMMCDSSCLRGRGCVCGGKEAWNRITTFLTPPAAQNGGAV